MSVYIDKKYLMMVSVRLPFFKQKSPDLFNFKCPYCGDSKKKQSKCRGFIFRKSNDYFYRCHNCNTSTTFYKFLDYIDSSLAKEYSLERYLNGESKHAPYEKPIIKSSIPVFEQSYVDITLPSIRDLEDDNCAKKYVINRKIPKGYHKDLYYAEDFKKFVLKLCPKYKDHLIDNDPRLVIPFRNENGELKALQGRTLTKNSLRYITVKLDEDFPKIYGLDKINKKETIRVVEGPIDSMFIKNCLASSDSSLDTVVKHLNMYKDVVLIPDKEPRNTQIVKNIEKWIKNRYSICLLPEKLKGKDINEFILNGISKPELMRVIDDHTYSGLQLELEFLSWKKC